MNLSSSFRFENCRISRVAIVNRFEPATFALLNHLLVSMAQLEKLSLHCLSVLVENKCGDVALDGLFRYLIIADSQLTDEGLAAMMEGLSSLSNLQELTFSGNAQPVILILELMCLRAR